MARKIYCRKRNNRVQVYVEEYDSSRKRGVQRSLGSLDYWKAINTYTGIENAIESAAGEKLEQRLDPTEWTVIRDWVSGERDRIERRRKTSRIEFAPMQLNELAAVFEEARDLEDVRLPNGEAAHAALDRLRKAMKRAGVHRPKKAVQKASQDAQNPNQMSWLEESGTDDHDQAENGPSSE